MKREIFQPPRRRATSDIKLLRLEILPRHDSPCEEIGIDWSPAQPTDNLSPDTAAEYLSLEPWAPESVVQARYRQLQLRYPPEQFGARHIRWRPSAELLGHARTRLNWFWQSGLIPSFWSETPAADHLLWDSGSVEPPVTPDTALRHCISTLLKSNLASQETQSSTASPGEE